MAKDPAFLFYPADFMIGTALFTYEQRGKYVTLLCYQHQIGHLTKEDMIAVCGSEDKKIFKKFEIDQEGLYYNKRLENELTKRRSYTESRIKNLNSHKRSHMESRKANHMENENINVNKKLIIQKVAKDPAFAAAFDALWERYPRKDGRKDALKHFNATVTTPEALAGIQKALTNYENHLKVNKTEPQYFKKGSTWFNNWKDWVNYKEPGQLTIDLEAE